MGYSYKHREFVYRHQYPKKSSALFTYHKYPAPGGGYLDDGICELCGRRGTYQLIEDEKPRCCYECYRKLRRSKEAAIDLTGLRSAKYISLEEAKRIVRDASGSGIAGQSLQQSAGLLLRLLGGGRHS